MKTETKTSLEAKVDLLLGLIHDLRERSSCSAPQKRRWLSTSDVGKHVGHSPRTIANWDQQNSIPNSLIKKVKLGDSYVIRLDGQDEQSWDSLPSLANFAQAVSFFVKKRWEKTPTFKGNFSELLISQNLYLAPNCALNMWLSEIVTVFP